MKKNYPELTPEQALELLKEENQLYADGFNERQVSGILQAKIAIMLNGKDYSNSYDNRGMTLWKLGAMAVGGFMLLGLTYATSALYDSCADSKYQERTQQQDTIEQRVETNNDPLYTGLNEE